MKTISLQMQVNMFDLMRDVSIDGCKEYSESVEFAELAEHAAYFPSVMGDAFCQCATAFVMGIVLACMGWPIE